MSKYRRIEINAYRRRVTVVSGEWRPADLFDAQPTQSEDKVSFNDTDLCEAVEPDSPEGQLILVEAVRSLEQRLSPAARAQFRSGKVAPPNRSALRRLWSRLRFFLQSNSRKLSFNENPAVKRSVED